MSHASIKYMPSIAFDIETIGENFDEMDACTQEVLTRWIKKTSDSDEEYRAKLEDVKNGLGFSPYTGEIVAIGVMDIERNRGAVYYQAPGLTHVEEEFENVILKPMTEGEMLEAFWQGARQYDTFVTFNGRAFDIPFMMIRSALHGIRPSRDLMSNRYVGAQRDGKHIDLLDQLTFYGAVWKGKPNLHLACRAFGIESPKAAGVTGDDVNELFQNKQFLDIAKYNVRDIVSTKELYEYWCEYLRLSH